MGIILQRLSQIGDDIEWTNYCRFLMQNNGIQPQELKQTEKIENYMQCLAHNEERILQNKILSLD